MEQSLLMATDTNTPVDHYFEMSVPKLVGWIRTANRAFKKRNEEIQKLRKQR